jgi:predicted permease
VLAAFRRIAGLFGTAARDRELERELQSHLQMQIDDNLRAGMAPDEARRQALARFGGVEAAKEIYREQRGVPFIETTLQDARYAVRVLGRSRGATLLGILVMALAIGANTAVFSVVHAVVLNPLPYDAPGRIVALTYRPTAATTSGDRSRQVSVPDFVDWQAESTSFEAMAYYTQARTSVMSRATAEYTVVATVTEDFLQVMAGRLEVGRWFSHDEGKEGGSGAVVVSDRYAREKFGDPEHALGHVVRLYNRSVPVVGVLAPRFDFPPATEMWFTAVNSRANLHRRGNNFRALARLKADVSLQQAQTEMTAISESLAARYPDTNKNERVLVTPIQREMVGDVQSMLYLLLGAVALVLLVACATMATLLLAKATSRVPEMAVRVALGASRVRIVRQLLVEAFVQAAIAGAAGIALAVWGTRALVALSPPDVPRLDEVAVNGTVLLFTVILCVLVTILFGLPPALQAARANVNEPLRQNASRSTGGGSRTREALVIVEIALAVVLVAGGALLVRSLMALQHARLGFDPANVLVMETTLRPRASDWSDSRAFFEGLLADVNRMPGVVAAGAMMGPPGRVSSESGYWVDRMPKESPLSSAHPAAMNVITPGTFAALGIPIRQGRDFRDSDRAGAPAVVIVNEAVARAAFPERDPVGRVIVAGYDSVDPMTIVGVVADVRQYGPGHEPTPELYLPYQQHFYNGATLSVVARTSTEPAALGASIQRKARERSPEVAVRVGTLEALLAEHVATPRFRAWLLSLFAAVALCLAMAGVYGVMSYVTAQRSKEIGLRMALGATAGSVRWLVLRRALTLTAIGLTAGVCGAAAATRFLAGMLFEVRPFDVTTYAAVIAALAALSLMATYWPARRATRIDPLLVLRHE